MISISLSVSLIHESVGWTRGLTVSGCLIETLGKSCFTQAYCFKTGPLRSSVHVAEKEPSVAIQASLIKIYPVSLLISYRTLYLGVIDVMDMVIVPTAF